MKLKLLVLPVLAALCAPAYCGDAQLEARVTEIQGGVQVHLAAQPEGQFTPAEQDMPLEVGDIIRTGAGAQAEITFDGESVVRVGPDSVFEIEDLNAEKSGFRLGAGYIVAKIQKLAGGREMSFMTATAVAAVRGTELAVACPKSGVPAQIGVFDEGKVVVRAAGGADEVVLGPNQETEVGADLSKIKVRGLKTLLKHKQYLPRMRDRLAAARKTWRARLANERKSVRERILKAAQRIHGAKPGKPATDLGTPSVLQKIKAARPGKAVKPAGKPSGAPKPAQPAKPAKPGPKPQNKAKKQPKN